MSKRFSLSKLERLKSKKDIDTLFLSGKAFFIFPFKIVYQFLNNEKAECPLLFGVSVPKRIFKRAVDRNLIKRKIRELYRVNKIPLQEFLVDQKKTLHCMFLYTHNEILTSKELNPTINSVLKKLEKQCKES